MGKTVRFILACVSFITLSGLSWAFPGPATAQEEPVPVILEADSVVYDQERGTATALGNAKVRYGMLRLFADSIFLDEGMTRLKATSPEERGVRVRYGTRALDGDSLEYRLDEGTGVVSKTRGEADAIRFYGDSVEFASVAAAKAKGWLKPKQARGIESDDLVIRGSAMSFTTCTEEQPAYRLKTKRLLVIPGSRVIAVKPQIYIEEHLVATYPFDYTVNLREGVAGQLMPTFFHDGTRGSGLAFRYVLPSGGKLQTEVDLSLSTEQAVEGAAKISYRFSERAEAFLDTSYLYNDDDDMKRWRPSWGLRSPEGEEDGFAWSLTWSQRENVDIRQGTGYSYKGTVERDPEFRFVSPWWGKEAGWQSLYRLFGTWGRFEEKGLDYERAGLGLEMKGEAGSTETFQPFWRGRAAFYDYDTGEDRRVLEGSLGLRWERAGWRFETRYDRRWVDGDSPMAWDRLMEIEEAYQTVDWPISERWRFAFRAGYDLQESRFHEMAYRLAYDRECYRVELFYIDDLTGDDDEIGLRFRLAAFPDNREDNFIPFPDPVTGGLSGFEEVFR